MQPLFSIIIPVYNVAPYLRECLDSVLSQTFTDWEAICVDDGSTDESGTILDEYAAKDSRLNVIHKENAGVSSARNVGLDVAIGDWVAFLDGDDVWAPWLLRCVAEAIDANKEADLIQFDTADFYESYEYPWASDSDKHFQIKVGDVAKVVSAGSVSCFFAGKVYNRRVVDGLRFEQYSVGEDLLFLNLSMMRARTQVYLNIVCYGYRQRVGSASHSVVSVRMQRDELGFVSKVLRAYDTAGKEIDKGLWRTYSNMLTEHFCAAQILLPKGERDQLWREWYEALREILRLKRLPRFQRIRIGLVLGLPVTSVAYLLCLLPYKLKKLGLHR